MNLNILSIVAPFVVALVFLSKANAAGGRNQMDKPDFTQGDTIPKGARHDWTLGATGARGWIYSHRMATSEARQIYITHVDAGSPAAGLLAVGDVLLGVGGKPFSYDARVEMGKALTVAESVAGKGVLSVIRWRKGKREQVIIKLPVLGSYSATAPYKCEKSKRIFERGCQVLAQKMKRPRYGKNPITRSLNALALLASGDEQYMPLIKREARWASSFSSESMATWYYGYVISFLAEYHMATGDDTVMRGMKRLALEAARGQSIVGSWGHKFAGDDGRLLGYGMMNAPGVTLTVSLVLAREAGVNDPKLDDAIERSLKLIRFYAGKGSIPYGDHSPWIETHDDNGKNGMAAVLFSLLGEKNAAEYFSRMSLACHGNERDTGHTGNFWNIAWAMPGVAQSGPHATGAWMHEFGAWYYDLARRWDGTFQHQGQPQMKPDTTNGWDSTGAYLLAYAMPLKKLRLTGRELTTVPQLTPEQAGSVVADGRGWSNNNRYEAYDQLSLEQLFERLASWSPVVRERAAIAIARKKNMASPVPNLLKMLESPALEARYGACQALARLRGKAAPAVPALRKCLQDKDLWLRIQAANALTVMGDAAAVALPNLLTMAARGASKEDPRAMEQRYLCYAVFGKMLNKTAVKKVDPELLNKAIVAGLSNQDGRARGVVANVYSKLSYEQIKPLLPAICEAVRKPAPSGIMFAGQVRIAGLELMAKHKIREGLPLCIDVMQIHKWGKKKRVTGCLDAIDTYGAAAKPLVPRLKQLIVDLKNHPEAAMMKPFVGRIQKKIKYLETTKETVELRSLQG